MRITTATFGLSVLSFAAGLVWLAVASLILAWPIELLWNWLIPGLFGVGSITYWQAFGLEVLVTVLFKADITFGLKTKKKEWED